MQCSRDSEDRLLKALVSKGINLIVPPRHGIAAGDLIIEDKSGGARRADWKSVFGLQMKADIGEGEGFRAYTFDAKSILDIPVAVRVVGRVFEAFGLDTAKISGSFASAKADKIHLSLIASASSTLKNIDAILDRLRKNGSAPKSGYADCRFYLVTTVWRAKGVRLDLLDRDKNTLSLSTDAAKEFEVGGQLGLKRETSGAYAYTASNTLVFGVGLRQFECNEHGVITDRSLESHLQFRQETGEPAPSFIGDDVFIDLADHSEASA